MFFSLLMTGFIYPVAAAWVWGDGWLHVLGFRDFAGAGVVHLLGGTCGMIGTVILGPRLGVFGEKLSSYMGNREVHHQRQDRISNDGEVFESYEQEFGSLGLMPTDD